MPKIEQSITIPSSPEDVFRAVSDVERSPVWISALTGIKEYAGTPEVGATFLETASFMGKTLETGKVITTFEPPFRFAHRSTSGPVPQELIMTVDPVGEKRSTLTISFEAEPNGFFGSLPVTVLVVAMEVIIKGNLKKLSSILEKDGWPPQG